MTLSEFSYLGELLLFKTDVLHDNEGFESQLLAVAA